MAEWISGMIEPIESEGSTVFLAVRTDVDKFRANPRFRYRIEILWTYPSDSKGMPLGDDSDLMENVQDAFEKNFKADPIAVLTETCTGNGERLMAFYTLSLHIFQRKVNEILSPFATLPLTFDAVDDPDWEEYQQAHSLIEDDPIE